MNRCNRTIASVNHLQGFNLSRKIRGYIAESYNQEIIGQYFLTKEPEANLIKKALTYCPTDNMDIRMTRDSHPLKFRQLTVNGITNLLHNSLAGNKAGKGILNGEVYYLSITAIIPVQHWHRKPSVFVILLLIFALTLTPISAHCRTLPHTAAQCRTVPYMLMHESLRENDKTI